MPTVHETISVLLVILTVFISSTIGLQIVKWLNPDNSRLENLGLGFLVGGATLALSAFGAVSLGLNYLWGPVIVTVVSMTTHKISRAHRTNNVFEFPTALEQRVLLQSLALALIGMNSYSLWSLALGFGILVMPSSGVVTFKTQRNRRIQSVVVLFMALVTALPLVNLQPDWWHAHSNDAPFFESLSWTLVNFGAGSHPGLLGGDVVGYHFLAYFWSGATSEFAGLAPLVALNVIFPFLASFSIALISLAAMHGGRRSNALFCILTFALIVSMMESSFTSFTLGSWGVVAYAFSQLTYLRTPLAKLNRSGLVRREVLLTLLGVIAILGKGTTLPIVLSLGIASSLARGLSQSWSTNGVRRLFPIHLLATSITALLWYSPTRSIIMKAELSPISNLSTLGLKEGLWASRDILYIIPTFILLAIALLLIFRKVPNFAPKVATYFLCTFSALATTSLFFFPEVNARNYISGHLLVAGIVLILGVVVGHVPAQENTTSRIAMALSLVLAAAVSLFDVFFLPELVARLWAVTPTRWIPLGLLVAKYPVILLTTMAVYGLLSKVSNRASVPKVPRQHILTATLTTFVISIGLWTSLNRIEQLTFRLNGDSSARISVNNASHPDKETWELGTWIRDNTPEQSVIATNSFCCKGTEWLDGALSEIEMINKNYQSLRNREVAYGGANYLLSAVSHRRFYLAGPRFTFFFIDDPQLVRSRLKYSLEFGNYANEESLLALREANVNYFILDKWVLDGNSPAEFFSANLFENTRYILVSLNS